MNSVKPVLWLASWYPNKFGPFDGDFIQRHAIALSEYRPVQVLFVKKGIASEMNKKSEVESFHRNGLTETICYYKPLETGIAGLNRLFSFLQFLLLYRKLIEEFISRESRPEFVHVHVTMRSGLLALWLKRKYRIPYIITEHWTGFSRHAEDNLYQQSWFFRKATAGILRNAEIVLPVCDYLADQIKKIAPDTPCQVIANVVDIKLFYPGEGGLGPVRFFHASSLHRQKNPEAILRAFASPGMVAIQWQLVVAGPATDALRKLGLRLGIDDKIIWLGEISYSAVADEMRRSDLFVMFSRFENLPCVVAEALCCGLRVISSRVGGIPEMLDEANGIIVDTEVQLAEAIEKISGNGRSQDRQEIASRAFCKYNYRKVAAEFEAVYLRLKI